MKSLFNEKYFSYNEKAIGLSHEINKIIRPIFKKYFEEGYSPIEIQKIMTDEIGLIYSETVILSSMKKWKKGNNNI